MAASRPLTDTDRSQFAQYAQAVVNTVPSVSDFVIGNEPNNNLFWQPQFGPDGHDAAGPAYFELLAATYDALKAADPHVNVIGGALAARGSDKPAAQRPTQSPNRFIEDLGLLYKASGRTKPVMARTFGLLPCAKQAAERIKTATNRRRRNMGSPERDKATTGEQSF